MRKYLLLMLFLCLHVLARGQTMEYEYRYWFNDEAEICHYGTSDTASWAMEVDVENLGEALHQLHVQVKDTAGRWSTPYSSYFLKMTPIDNDALKVRYWFDEAQEATEVQTVSGVHSIDVADLSWGLHTVHYQAYTSDGLHSPVRTALFMKTMTSTEDYTALCYVDEKLFARQDIARGGGVINWELDVNALSYGLHSVNVQVIDPMGNPASVVQGFFLRPHSTQEGIKCLYTLDEGRTMHEAPLQGGGFQFDADINSLPDGVHQLLCMVVDGQNTVLNTCTHYFIKKQENIVRYDYWVNDDVENLRSVVATTVTEPFGQSEMLEVGNYPLRSSYFHFEIEEGVPYVYAKNDLHVRFYSSNGGYVEEKRTFIDGMSKQEVADAILLQSGTRRTDATPGENQIRWYKVEAAADNSLTFCVSQPGSLQLFAPSGETLFDMAGEAVTDSFTCHAPMDGIYYVALHDVTGTEAETFIDFQLGDVKYYQVTYMIDGTVYQTDSIAYGALLKPIENPAKEGHTFSGWSGLPATMPAEDVTVTGSFTINKYLLAFVLDGNTIATDSVTYGMSFTIPEIPAKDGYTFSGWGEVPELMPDSNVVVTGTFILNAEQTDAQGLTYLLNDAKDAFSVSGYTHGLMADVIVPDTLYGLPVNVLLDGALKNAEVLETIVLPDGIASVGESAFSGCSSLLVVEWNAKAPLEAACFDEADEYGNMLVFATGATSSVTFEGNVIVDGVAEEITLTDGLPFRNPKAFTAKRISYSREFTKKTKIGVAGGWEGIVLPFDVQRIVSEEKGELQPFGQSDFTNALPCWIAEMQEDATFGLVDKISANRPFIMEVPNSDEYEEVYNIEGTVIFTSGDVTVHATDVQSATSENGFLFTGAYEGVGATPYVYALNEEEYTATDGSVFLPGGAFVSDLRDVRPFEAYVYNAQLTRTRYLSINGGMATGIDRILKEENKLVDVYTLQGVMIKRQIPVGQLEDELPAGLYIVDGKKMMVK